MTQAPTPGPLSASDVKLLVKGDLLRVTNADSFLEANGVKDGSVVRFRSADNTWIDLQEMDFPQGSSFARFAFIGRPDADGWMPWSGGANPVPGLRVDVRFRNGSEALNETSNAWCWENLFVDGKYSHDVIAWRPHVKRPASKDAVEACGSDLKADFVRSHPSGLDDSTYEKIEDALDRADAPITGPDGKFLTLAQRVDALRPQPSGETREHGPKCWGKTSASDEMAHCYCGSTDSPPGETREGIEAILREAVLSASVEVPQSSPARETMRIEITRNTTDAILALLSARPLALGGQQGEVLDSGHGSVYDRLLTLLHDRDHALRGETSTDPNEIDETVREILRITTPARAETQDEGAAGELKPCPFCGGEAEIIHLDDGDNAGGSCVCCTKCQASGNVEFGRKENFVDNWNRRAHPSPTPAADAACFECTSDLWGPVCLNCNPDIRAVVERGPDQHGMAKILRDQLNDKSRRLNPGNMRPADADRVREAVEALEPFAAHPDFHAGDDWPVTFVNDEERVPGVTAGDFRRAAKAIAALKSEAK